MFFNVLVVINLMIVFVLELIFFLEIVIFGWFKFVNILCRLDSNIIVWMWLFCFFLRMIGVFLVGICRWDWILKFVMNLFLVIISVILVIWYGLIVMLLLYCYVKSFWIFFLCFVILRCLFVVDVIL